MRFKKIITTMVLSVLLITTILPSIPVYATTSAVKMVATSVTHTAILKTDGTLWMCGQNYSGQLGLDNIGSQLDPVQVMTGVKDVGVGKNFTAVLKTDGSLWTFGSNIYGQLGTTLAKNTYISSTPIQVLTGVKDLSVGDDYVMVIKADNTLWGWGCNSAGVLADSTIRVSFKPVEIMDKVWQVSAGESHVAVIKTNGSLWTWGDSNTFKLGYFATKGIVHEPKQITAWGVQSAVAGAKTTAFIKTDGTLWMCGFNDAGQLGIGTKYVYGSNPSPDTQPTTPVKVMSDVKSVALSGGHTVALRTDGSLYSWGANGWGQLGNGTRIDSLSPVKVMTGVSSVAASNLCTIAVKSDGSLWAWGTGVHTYEQSTNHLGSMMTTVPVQW